MLGIERACLRRGRAEVARGQEWSETTRTPCIHHVILVLRHALRDARRAATTVRAIYVYVRHDINLTTM